MDVDTAKEEEDPTEADTQFINETVAQHRIEEDEEGEEEEEEEEEYNEKAYDLEEENHTYEDNQMLKARLKETNEELRIANGLIDEKDTELAEARDNLDEKMAQKDDEIKKMRAEIVAMQTDMAGMRRLVKEKVVEAKREKRYREFLGKKLDEKNDR
jgi:hypothetical protein